MLSKLAVKSLLNRKVSAFLTLISLTVSVFLLVSVEHARTQTKESFNRTVSGVDMIVGARTSSLNLLLHSVFRIGNPSNTVSWESMEMVQSHPQVSWVIPISLGDSHRGFAVLGTNEDYFKYYQYGNQQPLKTRESHSLSDDVFAQPLTSIVGSDVAKQLGYQVGDEIILSHGTGNISFTHHDDHKFTIAAILQKTGTPIDKTVHISMHDLAHIHGQESLPDKEKKVTAFLVGLNSPIAVLQLQYHVNQYQTEALSAIVPGVALAELWNLIGIVEKVLLLITVLVLISSMLGLAIMLLSSMRERAQEMKILRVIGAKPITLFYLLQLESLVLTILGVGLGVFVSMSFFMMFNSFSSDQYGIFVSANVFNLSTLNISLAVLTATFLVSFIPAMSAYRSNSALS